MRLFINLFLFFSASTIIGQKIVSVDTLYRGSAYYEIKEVFKDSTFQIIKIDTIGRLIQKNTVKGDFNLQEEFSRYYYDENDKRFTVFSKKPFRSYTYKTVNGQFFKVGEYLSLNRKRDTTAYIIYPTEPDLEYNESNGFQSFVREIRFSYHENGQLARRSELICYDPERELVLKKGLERLAELKKRSILLDLIGERDPEIILKEVRFDQSGLRTWSYEIDADTFTVGRLLKDGSFQEDKNSLNYWAEEIHDSYSSAECFQQELRLVHDENGALIQKIQNNNESEFLFQQYYPDGKLKMQATNNMVMYFDNAGEIFYKIEEKDDIDRYEICRENTGDYSFMYQYRNEIYGENLDGFLSKKKKYIPLEGLSHYVELGAKKTDSLFFYQSKLYAHNTYYHEPDEEGRNLIVKRIIPYDTSWSIKFLSNENWLDQIEVLGRDNSLKYNQKSAKSLKYLADNPGFNYLKQYSGGYIEKHHDSLFTLYNKSGKVKFKDLKLAEIPSKTLNQLFTYDTVMVKKDLAIMGPVFENLFEGEVRGYEYDKKKGKKIGYHHGRTQYSQEPDYYGDLLLIGNFKSGERTGEWKYFNVRDSISFLVSKELYSPEKIEVSFFKMDSKRNLLAHYEINLSDADKIEKVGVLKNKFYYTSDTIPQSSSLEVFKDSSNGYLYEKYENQILVKSGYKLGALNGYLKGILNKPFYDIWDQFIYNDKGVLHGKQYEYYSNGQVERMSTYDHGKQNGPHNRFAESGLILAKVNYTNGKAEGKSTVWHDNGNIWWQGAYHEGNKVGEWSYFNVDGTLSSKYDHSEKKQVQFAQENEVVQSIHNINQEDLTHFAIPSRNRKFALEVIYDRGFSGNTGGAGYYNLWDISKKKIISQNIKLDIIGRFGDPESDVGVETKMGVMGLILSDDGKSIIRDSRMINLFNNQEKEAPVNSNPQVFKKTKFAFYWNESDSIQFKLPIIFVQQAGNIVSIVISKEIKEENSRSYLNTVYQYNVNEKSFIKSFELPLAKSEIMSYVFYLDRVHEYILSIDQKYVVLNTEKGVKWMEIDGSRPMELVNQVLTMENTALKDDSFYFNDGEHDTIYILNLQNLQFTRIVKPCNWDTLHTWDEGGFSYKGLLLNRGNASRYHLSASEVNAFSKQLSSSSIFYTHNSDTSKYFSPIPINRPGTVMFANALKNGKKEKYVNFFFTKDQKQFFYTPDNYYYGAGDISNLIYFERGGQVYPLEQFDLKYNRPDIILDRLGYADSSMVAAYHRAYLKRLKKMNFTEEMLKDDFHLPEIEIENFQEFPDVLNEDKIDLNLRMKDSKYPLDRINIWVNDVAVFGKQGVSLRALNKKELNKEVKVALGKGKNKVQVSVLNQAGAESYKETFEIECTVGKEKSDLFLITIGESEFQQADFNLTYAAKDAKDVANLFQNSEVFAEVKTKTLTNEQVTRENVNALRSFLEEADINDQVLVFVAGHGVLSADLDFYLATYDMDFNAPEKRGLLYEDLEALLDGIKPLKKTLILDACHSGEIDKSEVELASIENEGEGNIKFRAVNKKVQSKLGAQNTLQLTKNLFTDLRKGTGATVISSAGGMEFAMESDEWKNGLFTYCLLHGIKSEGADLNQDGEIWLSELQEYIGEEVLKMSKGRQQPTSRIENQTVDFRVW